MDNLSITIKSKFGAALNGASFKDRIEQTLYLTVKINENQATGYCCSVPHTEVTNLLYYLRTYREKPEDVQYDPKISRLLSKLLFKNIKGSDSYLGLLSNGSLSSLILKTTEADRQLLTNIPWELALKQQLEHNDQEKYDQTLASLPLARSIEGYQSKPNLHIEGRLRVFCCISEPPNNQGTSIKPEEFYRDLKEALENRPDYIDYTFLGNTENKFQVNQQQLLTRLQQFDPHIVIQVSHGRTNRGIPQLQFADGWLNVCDIANYIKGTNTHMVYLNACDLTHEGDASEDQKSASGALEFLKVGIPAVVAMQSSILVDAGKIFIHQLAQYLLSQASKNNSSSLLTCVKNTRRDILLGIKPQYIDWSFPALFLCEDYHYLDNVYKQINFSRIAYQWLWKSNFSVPDNYFPRTSLEDRLSQLMNGSYVGVQIIRGITGSGKTLLINNVGHQLFSKATEMQNTTPPRILYIDIKRFGESDFQNFLDIFSVFKQRLEGISPPGENFHLFEKLGNPVWQKDEMQQYMGLLLHIDRCRAIFILDNVSQSQVIGLQPFLMLAKEKLQKSLLLVVETTLSNFIPTEDMRIPNFKKEEVAEYLRDYGNLDLNPEEVYQKTKGNPFLVAGVLRQPTALELLNPEDSLEEAKITLSDDEANTLFSHIEKSWSYHHTSVALALSLVNQGLSEELAGYWIGDYYHLLEDLSTSPVISSVKKGRVRFYSVVTQVAESWNFLFEEQLDQIISWSLAKFYQQCQKMGDFDSDDCQFLVLLQKSGGFEFIKEVIQVCIKSLSLLSEGEERKKRIEFIKSIPRGSTNTLYKQGRWFEAYELWRLLDDLEEQLSYGDLLLFGKSASLIGYHTRAISLLEKSKQKEDNLEDSILIIDRHLLEAKVLKDNHPSKVEEITRLQSEAYRIICETLESESRGTSIYERNFLLKRLAVCRYDQAITSFWLEKKVDKALDQFREAECLYEEVEDDLMIHVVKKELADILIDSDPLTNDHIQIISKNLYQTKNYFFQSSNHSELLEVYYRLARFYKNKFRQKIGEVNKSAELAIKYYDECLTLAKELHNRRFQLFAGIHKSWMEYIQEIKSVSECRKTLKCLVTEVEIEFPNGAWETRLLRNTYQKMLVLDGNLSNKADWEENLISAFRYGISNFLTANSTTDKRKLSIILFQVIQLKENQGGDALVDFFYNHLDKIILWFQVREFSIFSSQEFRQQLIQTN